MLLQFTPDVHENEITPAPGLVFAQRVKATTPEGRYVISAIRADESYEKILAHEHELSNPDGRDLNDVMEIGHVVEVRPSGLILDGPPGIYAPDVYLDSTEAPEGWEFLDGYSSQDRYSGPHMADNESIGNSLEDDIRATPGFYVAQVVTDLSADTDEGEDDVAGWVVLRKL